MLLETIKQFGGVKLVNITTWDQLANCEFHAFKVLNNDHQEIGCITHLDLLAEFKYIHFDLEDTLVMDNNTEIQFSTDVITGLDRSLTALIILNDDVLDTLPGDIRFLDFIADNLSSISRVEFYVD